MGRDLNDKKSVQDARVASKGKRRSTCMKVPRKEQVGALGEEEGQCGWIAVNRGRGAGVGVGGEGEEE